jgi:hypothetical protein
MIPPSAITQEGSEGDPHEIHEAHEEWPEVPMPQGFEAIPRECAIFLIGG